MSDWQPFKNFGSIAKENEYYILSTIRGSDENGIGIIKKGNNIVSKHYKQYFNDHFKIDDRGKAPIYFKKTTNKFWIKFYNSGGNEEEEIEGEETEIETSEGFARFQQPQTQTRLPMDDVNMDDDDDDDDDGDEF